MVSRGFYNYNVQFSKGQRYVILLQDERKKNVKGKLGKRPGKSEREMLRQINFRRKLMEVVDTIIHFLIMIHDDISSRKPSRTPGICILQLKDYCI